MPEETTIAYTIGNESNYDKTLAESKASGRPMRKTGKGDQGRDADYPGGWVFDDLDRAVAATLDAPMLLGSSAVFAVYELELPGTWDECTYTYDGARHLLVDAEVRRKVETTLRFRKGMLVRDVSGTNYAARVGADFHEETTTDGKKIAEIDVRQPLAVYSSRHGRVLTLMLDTNDPETRRLLSEQGQEKD
jgi:hypothetical protein